MFSVNIFIISGFLYAISGLVSTIEASCPLANKTAEIVSSCPQTDEEWEKAAKRKNCENITHLCQSYIYHCVINAWMNATIEVCAPSRFIIGQLCTEFNFGGNKIQGNYNAKCQQCPVTYNSSTAFKYRECYEYVKRPKEIPVSKPPKTTEATIIPIYFQSSSTTTSKNSGDVQEENGSSHTKSKMSIVIGVSVPTAALIVLFISLVFRCNGQGPTSCGQTQDVACSAVKRNPLSYCVPTKQTTGEADSLADQNGSADTQKITLTDETRLQPLIDHANM